MWQRIQTLYLLIATGLVVALFFVNYTSVIGPDGEVARICFSEKLPFLLLAIMLLTAELSSILTFKLRILQMRVAVIAGLLALGFQGWVAVDFFRYHNELVFSIPAVFPLVIAILDFMAARNIMLDEAMVQEASRLRGPRKKRR